MLEGFLKIAGLGLHFFEQLHVLDRDNRLIGKSLQQLNLFLAEWAYLYTAKRNDTDALAFAKKRYGQYGATTVAACEFAAVGKLLAFGREAHVQVCDRLPRAP